MARSLSRPARPVRPVRGGRPSRAPAHRRPLGQWAELLATRCILWSSDSLLRAGRRVGGHRRSASESPPSQDFQSSPVITRSHASAPAPARRILRRAISPGVGQTPPPPPARARRPCAAAGAPTRAPRCDCAIAASPPAVAPAQAPSRPVTVHPHSPPSPRPGCQWRAGRATPGESREPAGRAGGGVQRPRRAGGAGRRWPRGGGDDSLPRRRMPAVRVQ